MEEPFVGGRVAFDFEGSLELARKLWALAVDLEAADAGRQRDFETAKAKWLGKYGDEFVTRRDTEKASCIAVVNGLKEDAKAWATAWATAMEQQGENNRRARVEEVSANRSGGEKLVDYLIGDDSDEQVPSVATVLAPTPPLFLPTATEQRF